jgi:hypothetical protein
MSNIIPSLFGCSSYTWALHHLYLPNEKIDRLGEFTIQGIVSKHSLTSSTTSILLTHMLIVADIQMKNV